MLNDHIDARFTSKNQNFEYGFTHQTRGSFRYSNGVRGVAARHRCSQAWACKVVNTSVNDAPACTQAQDLNLESAWTFRFGFGLHLLLV
jgi:hypothetical protein